MENNKFPTKHLKNGMFGIVFNAKTHEIKPFVLVKKDEQDYFTMAYKSGGYDRLGKNKENTDYDISTGYSHDSNQQYISYLAYGNNVVSFKNVENLYYDCGIHKFYNPDYIWQR